MSEIIKEEIVEEIVETPVEKSSEDKIIDLVKSVAEEKVSKEELKSAVEGLEIPSIDGLAKSEELEAAKSEVAELKGQLEDLNVKFDSAPTIISNRESKTMKFADIEHNGAIVKGVEYNVIEKAISDNTDIAGGRVEATMPYYKLEQANPIGRQLGTILMASGGVVKLPDVSGISFASEAAHPGNTPRNAGGTLASKNVTIETWVSENSASLASLQDVPGLDTAIAGLMVGQLGKSESADAVAVLKAENFANDREITTGVATGFPTNANIVGKMSDLVTGVEASYRSTAAFVVSRGLFAVIQQSNNTGLNFDPRTGLTTMFGYPIMIVDALEDASVDGNLNAVFGDFGAGMALCSAMNMTIGRYDQTRPGAMTYFGQARFKHAVWDVNALSTLKTGA